jgi:hypothetical protein
MPVHDAYARWTPFELALPEGGFADERFPRVQEEAQERGADLADPEAFPLLGEVGALLRDLREEEGDPQLLSQFAALLFQCFHFWKEGHPLFLLETGVMRFLAQTGPEEGAWTPSLPGGAGYVQLPQHLIWTPGGEGEAPESLDGFFWAAPNGEDLTLLVVMGLRKDRPGVSIVPLPTLPLTAAGPWASVQVRPEGEDFSSSLPGAELENLYALEAGAEAVKLAMRVFWYLDSFPASVAGGEEPADPGKGEGNGSPQAGPRASQLPYRRIVLGD